MCVSHEPFSTYRALFASFTVSSLSLTDINTLRALCKSVTNTLHSQCEKPRGLSKVDGFISGCYRENAHRLDQRFYIIFLQPTHTSHSPTSDKNLSDRMWLTSFGSWRLNSSSVTLLRWPLSSFHCPYFFSLSLSLSLVVKHNALLPLMYVVILKNTLFYRNLHTVKIRFWLYSHERHLTAVLVYRT